MTELVARVPIRPLNFARSFVLQNLGFYDPTASLTANSLRKAFATSNGSCVVTIVAADDGVELRCEGADAEQIMTELAASFSVDDGHDSFAPNHALLRRLHGEQPGLRLIRVPWLFDAVCSAILQQRVRFEDAAKEWRRIAERHGAKTALGMAVFPSASRLAALPQFELESLGMDAKRARTLISAARELKMNPLRPTMTYTQIRGRLGRVTGVGPWTVETVLGFGAADPDALPIGDLYLPHLVAFALAGEPKGSDERMVELLEPFRGQRFRVARLLYGSRISPPRTGPSRR